MRRNPRSLAVTAAFRTFVLDQLEPLGEVTPRSMFGGVGLYFRGVFFGLLARDTLFLKVGESNRRDYAEHGMRPFKPYPDRSGTMQYFEVPLSVLECQLDLVEWARKAIAVANGVSAPMDGRRSGSRNRPAARDPRRRGQRDSSYRTRRR